MFVQSLLLAGFIICPLILRLFYPYLWTDFLYHTVLMRILLKFASRRRRRPLFLALDRFLEQVETGPNKPFIVFENKSYTFKDVDRESNRIANALRTASVLRPGDTAVLFMLNEPTFIFSWLALAKLGCSCALLNSSIRARSLITSLIRCCSGVKLLIASAELQGAVEEVSEDLQQDGVKIFIVAEDLKSSYMKSLTRAMRESADTAVPQTLRANVSFTSPAVYIYTSGTTGLPKAAVINETRLLAALAVLASNGVTDRDVIYVTLPLYHTAGFLIGFLGSVETGSTIVLRRKFSASQFWDECRSHKVTVIQYIGEVLRYLCNTPQRENDKVHSVRLAIGNGLRADVWREFHNRFGKIEVREFYASTEGNVGFVNYAGKIGAIGRVSFLHKKLFPYALIKYDTERDEPVRDSTGLCIEVPKGQTGLLVSKITEIAPFVGYAQNKQQTEKKRLCNVFKSGDVYFNSGDLMKIDNENFIYFQDRVGDTFRWKGENVATTEVSDILSMLDFVEEANVYGVQVPGHEGRIGMAAVKIRGGMEFDRCKMFNHVCSFLPAYALPRFIRIQNSMEVTGTFKQLKLKLVQDGFDPTVTSESLYFLCERERMFVSLTSSIYEQILSGSIKL
ncbi:long-chain fatty acid transport protein 2-like isoform X1 [Xyrauchen texanus]|uniref:long-chain fatty acid transport protein 2-like isoform X1 n=1 Tax=Xyrauchen texanus TaxID=154827 RepID=UPI0022427977|nr:long-chain fatty acid transport protein 2-like isoform X1 [Xyrauchen texanus]